MKIQKTTPHRNWLLLTAIFLLTPLISKQLSAQEIIITPPEQLSDVEEDNEIILIQDANGQTAQINFVCKVSGDVCAVFDLRENNPFLRESYPPYQNKENKTIFPMYDLSRVSKAEIMQTFLPTMGEKPYSGCDATYTATYGATFLEHKDTNKAQHILIRYAVYLYDELEELLALNQYWLRMDNKGQIVLRVKNMYQNMYNRKTTEDGRYWAYLSGGLGTIHTECNIRGVNAQTGFQIFDTHTGKIVVNILPEYGRGLGAPGVWGNKGNKISISYRLKNRKREYHIFDMNNQREYIKLFDYKTSSIRRFLDNGVILFDGQTQKEEILYYEKDFIVKPIKK